jgi:hypothetical protein
MSFSLYGPIFAVGKTATDRYNEVTIIPIGRYIYFHGQRAGIKILDYRGNVIRDIKYTDDFARLWNLNLLRLNATQGEHFFGYGDGQLPRCQPRAGTCGAEFEKCLDDGTCTLLCPTPRYHCDEGNFGAPFYDTKTKALFIDGHCTGSRIYKYDPVNGYIDDWMIDGTNPYCGGAGILTYDETYFYLLWQHRERPHTADLYRCRWDTLRNAWKSTPYLKDTCELIARNLAVGYERNTQTMPEQFGWIVDYCEPGEEWDRRILRPDGTVESIGTDVNLIRVYATRYLLAREDHGTIMYILDAVSGEVLQTINLPRKHSSGANFAQQRPPFIVLTDDSRYYVYLLKYVDFVPVIQYDPSTRKFRVVDLITGNPIPARVKIWCSSIGYPSGRFPLAVTPSEITVSDWTSPPACDKGAVTIEISEILAG